MLLSNLQYHKRVPSARSWVSILLVAGCALGLLVPVQGFTATPNLSTICEPHFSQRSRLFSSDLDQDQDAMAKMQEDLMAEKILTQEKQIEETEKATADPKAQMPDLTKELAASKTKLEEKPKFLGLPTDLLLQRTMDTFEDVIVHLKRIPAEKGWTKASGERIFEKNHCGSGEWLGCARTHEDCRLYQVSIGSRITCESLCFHTNVVLVGCWDCGIPQYDGSGPGIKSAHA